MMGRNLFLGLLHKGIRGLYADDFALARKISDEKGLDRSGACKKSPPPLRFPIRII